MDLDQENEVISFEFLWTTYKASATFEAAWKAGKIGSGLKPNHNKQI